MNNPTDNIVDAVEDDLPPTSHLGRIKQEHVGRRHSFSSSRRNSEEHLALLQPPAVDGYNHNANHHHSSGSRNSSWGYDYGSRQSSGWMHSPGNHRHRYRYASGGDWGHPHHHGSNYYGRSYYGPPPPDSAYERPSFNFPEPPSLNIFDDPIPFRSEGRASIPPPPADAETPTRSNRGSLSWYQHHHYHNNNHYPASSSFCGSIQRQFSWDDWEYCQPPMPRRDSNPPPMLQRLHHYHRENDLLDAFSRNSGGTSIPGARSSPSPPEFGPPPVKNDNESSHHASESASPAAASVPTPAGTTLIEDDGFIQEVRPYDILSGRGIKPGDHVGNKFFNNLIQKHQVNYLASIRNNKAVIAMNIMEQIRKKGGRFLKRIKLRKYEAVGGGAWQEMAEKQVYDKVCQALREGAPRIRQKMLALSNSTDSTDKENSKNRVATK